MLIKQTLKQALEEAVLLLLKCPLELWCKKCQKISLVIMVALWLLLWAKKLRKNPAEIAKELITKLDLPKEIARVEAVGAYINFHVETASFVQGVVEAKLSLPAKSQKIIIEHTSVNPNKEAHVGHLRNIVLGDSCARILKAAGYGRRGAELY